jgi:hypothetical protein
MTYAEKLKDPRWQKKRLEVLNEAGFTCENCGDGKEELSVHHRYYKKGADPWEYDMDDYVVMCKKCHSRLHDAKKELDRVLGEITEAETMNRVIGYCLALFHDAWPGDLNTEGHITGYSDAYRTTPSTVRYLIGQAQKVGSPLSPTVILGRQMLD